MTITIHPFAAEDWELMRVLRLATLRDAPRAFGSTFAEESVAMAAGGGADTVRLWVETGNLAARRLYARHGFEPTGRSEPMRGAPGREQLEMVRREAGSLTPCPPAADRP